MKRKISGRKPKAAARRGRVRPTKRGAAARVKEKPGEADQMAARYNEAWPESPSDGRHIFPEEIIQEPVRH